MPWLYFLHSELLLCSASGLELWDTRGVSQTLELPRPSLAVATPQRRCCLLARGREIYALESGQRHRAFEAPAPVTALSCNETLVASAMGDEVALWSLQGQRLGRLHLGAALEQRSWAFCRAEALAAPCSSQLLLLEEVMARGPRS